MVQVLREHAGDMACTLLLLCRWSEYTSPGFSLFIGCYITLLLARPRSSCQGALRCACMETTAAMCKAAGAC